MTKQSKTFIDLSDVLSFRFECPGCHCSAIIPVDGFMAVPAACPNRCGKEWEQQFEHGVSEAFRELVNAMRLVQRKTAHAGLPFSLEIREEPKPSVSQISGQGNL